MPAPPSTKPLVTAPPSPLLDEVVAAYDAAYADLRAALFAMDANHPDLGRHIAGAQLDKWRELIGEYASEGLTARASGRAGWRRVEAIHEVEPRVFELEVCRYDDVEGVGPDGDVRVRADRTFRYVETVESFQEELKWSARSITESSSAHSDCALP